MSPLAHSTSTAAPQATLTPFLDLDLALSKALNTSNYGLRGSDLVALYPG